MLVSPVNMLPMKAKANGAKIIIVNDSSTAMDEIADLFIIGKLGKILPEIVEEIEKK